MTRAPDGLLAVRNFVIQHVGPKMYLGIVAGAKNTARWGAFGYHYGTGDLPGDDYSVLGTRNNVGKRAGNFSAAIDLGVWAGSRTWLAWLVRECRNGRYLDLHGIIGSLDGKHQNYWSVDNNWQGVPYTAGYGNHRTHTHLEWWRDSVHRSQVGVLADWPGWHPAKHPPQPVQSPPKPSPSPSPPTDPPTPSASATVPPERSPAAQSTEGHATLGPGGAIVGLGLAGLAWILHRRMRNENS